MASRKRQTPARSASHGERDAQPAAELARVVTIHVYTRLEKPAPDARPDDAPRRAADARRPYETKRAVVRYYRAAFLSQFEGRQEPGASSEARVTRTRF